MNRLQSEAPDKLVGNNISRGALKSELRPAVHKSIERFYKKSSKPKIPNHEQLRVGDIILSRPLKGGKASPSLVETAQLEHDYGERDAYWTHASLYVGDLHIIESQGFKDKDFWKIGWRKSTGIQVKPITKYSCTHDIKIMRHSNERFIDIRGLVARFALLDHAVHPRRYDWQTALEVAETTPKNVLNLRTKPNLTKRINCSEFILECYAIGGSVLIEEYLNVREGVSFFFPATFSQHNSFQEVKFDFLAITEE